MTDDNMPSGVKAALWGVGLLVAIMLFLWLKPFATVKSGFKGVVLKWGRVDRVVNDGFNWIAPIGEEIIEVDVRTQKEEVQASAASKDLQTVSTRVAVNYNIVTDKVEDLYKGIGLDYHSKIVDPAIQEAVKSATAKHTAEELITKRETVKDEITTTLRTRLANGFLAVTEVSITDFDFSVSFNAAIEAKVTAEQKAKEAENKLKQVEAEAKQSVAKAQAEAESIRLQGNAANSENYIRLKQLEVQAEFARKWNGTLPVNIYGSAPIPFLDLAK